jgi:hypothetical protein
LALQLWGSGCAPPPSSSTRQPLTVRQIALLRRLPATGALDLAKAFVAGTA